MMKKAETTFNPNIATFQHTLINALIIYYAIFMPKFIMQTGCFVLFAAQKKQIVKLGVVIYYTMEIFFLIMEGRMGSFVASPVAKKQNHCLLLYLPLSHQGTLQLK